MALPETDIKTFKPDPGRDIWKSDGAGLYLRIQSRGLFSWVWRRKRAGVTSYTTIGEWPAMPVRKAREALAKRTGHATPPNAAAHSKNGIAHLVYLVAETRTQFNGSPPLLFRSVSPTACRRGYAGCRPITTRSRVSRGPAFAP